MNPRRYSLGGIFICCLVDGRQCATPECDPVMPGLIRVDALAPYLPRATTDAHH